MVFYYEVHNSFFMQSLRAIHRSAERVSRYRARLSHLPTKNALPASFRTISTQNCHYFQGRMESMETGSCVFITYFTRLTRRVCFLFRVPWLLNPCRFRCRFVFSAFFYSLLKKTSQPWGCFLCLIFCLAGLFWAGCFVWYGLS